MRHVNRFKARRQAHEAGSGHTGWARRRFESTALTLWVDGVRERVESARDELLKRPRALEGTSVAAMDVARATKSSHATGHMGKKAQGLHPFGGRTNF